MSHESELRRLDGKTPWEFACSWYSESEIAHYIARSDPKLIATDNPKIPTDVYSKEFATWLTHQYRLAMNKGIELAFADELHQAQLMRERLEEIVDDLEQIVCVKEPDDGVVLLSNDGPTHYDADAKCQVYNHQHFSPLGDALIALHKKLTDITHIPAAPQDEVT